MEKRTTSELVSELEEFLNKVLEKNFDKKRFEKLHAILT